MCLFRLWVRWGKEREAEWLGLSHTAYQRATIQTEILLVEIERYKQISICSKENGKKKLWMKSLWNVKNGKNLRMILSLRTVLYSKKLVYHLMKYEHWWLKQISIEENKILFSNLQIIAWKYQAKMSSWEWQIV